MKKTRITAVALALTGVLALGAAAATVQQITADLRPDITLEVDGKDTAILSADGSTVYPISYNGTTYLPVRAVAEALGKDVDWDAKTRTVILTTPDDQKPGASTGEQTEYTGNAKSFDSRIGALDERVDKLEKSWSKQTYRTLDRDVDSLDDELEQAYHDGKLTREEYRALDNSLDQVDDRLDRLEDLHDDDWDD